MQVFVSFEKQFLHMFVLCLFAVLVTEFSTACDCFYFKLLEVERSSLLVWCQSTLFIFSFFLALFFCRLHLSSMPYYFASTWSSYLSCVNHFLELFSLGFFITTHVCGKVMFSSCLCFCLSVCVRVPVRAVIFEADWIESFFLVQW